MVTGGAARLPQHTSMETQAQTGEQWGQLTLAGSGALSGRFNRREQLALLSHVLLQPVEFLGELCCYRRLAAEILHSLAASQAEAQFVADKVFATRFPADKALVTQRGQLIPPEPEAGQPGIR